METVQLQCGHCQKVMAISVQHLGGQVKCPHCQMVVQTPAPSTPAQASEQEGIVASEESPIKFDQAPETPPSSESQSPAPIETELSSLQRRPAYDKSIVPVMIMIFLVPYSIMMTLFVLYLLYYHVPNQPHPLDIMIDPKTKGAPRPTTQIRHDYPLAAHQKINVGQVIRIGDLEAKPERVVLTKRGDLQLVLRARNISANHAFEPINDFYMLYSPSNAKNADATRTKPPPYSFLECTTKNMERIYGGFMEYQRKVPGQEDEPIDTVLRPREEATIVITTMDNYQANVKAIAKSGDDYVWRVHVRRGLVKHRNKEFSATAVFGVQFNSKQIESEG